VTTAFSVDQLARELESVLTRLDGGTPDPDALLSALAGLRSSVEELRVVEEELVRQHDELADAHAQIDAERRRYEDLFALAPDAFFVTDLDAKILEANLGAEELLGTPRRFLEGKPLATFVAPAWRRGFRTTLIDLRRHPNRIRTHHRFERRGGIAFDADVSVSPIVDRGTDVVGLRWVVTDVTEQKQNEARLWELNAELERRVEERAVAFEAAHAELMRERAQFETVLRQLPVGILVVSPSGDVIVRNRHAEELLGGSVPDSSSLAARLRDADGRSFVDGDWPLARALESSEVVSGEVLTLVRADSDRVLLEVSSAPITRDDLPAGAVFLFRDVTAERQRDLAQREFVVNAAHELRTPLASIVSAIEVLQGGAKNDPATRDIFLGHIERESDRLVRLARALLLLARAQAHEEQPRLELVPIRPMLDELTEEIHPAAGVTVHVACEDELAALTSAELLRQALSSLASNAGHYTGRGSITLRAEAQNGQSVAVEVVDTGPGLSPHDRELVTRRFVRGSQQSEGFGLGLAIAAEAARAAGGRLEIDSEEGRGTTARIVLQLARLVDV
jgi:two-component system phosphate regulon sensor histidine kinase PhoR